jgi:hypothetical protein
MHELVEILAAYPEYERDLVGTYPKLKQSFLVQSRLNVLDAMMPNTGDSGSVGAWGRRRAAATYLLGYKLYRDPRFARLAWREHKTHGASLRRDTDIFETNPDGLTTEVQSVAGERDGLLKCDHFGRYGQAYLQTEHKDNGRAVFIHYGQGKGHSHHDSLNIGLLAKNVAMTPDLGYPEYTGRWPKRHAWTANTISHNTLQIGDTRSAYSPGGQLELFASAPPLRAMQVNAPDAYEEVKTYRRTVALVDVGENDSYVFDVFRARGGTNHRLSWHGAGSDARVTGFEPTKQEGGTFAGPDVPFAKLDGVRGEFYKASGFTYLYDVARSAEPVEGPYTVLWTIEDIHSRVGKGSELHLRLHALTPCDEVALATGDPPRKKQQLRYVIQSRLGDARQSQFVNVLEPYDKTPFIKQVRSLKVEHAAEPTSVAAVAVDLTDGRTDVLITCERPIEVTVEGGITFNGTFGFIRLVNGGIELMRMCGGTLLTHGDTELTATQAVWRGTVLRVDTANPDDNRVVLDPPLSQDAGLTGRTIHFLNDLPMDTSYEIKTVTPDGISTGDITIVRGFKEPKEFAAGHTYLVNPGDEYVVPSIAGWD